MEFCFGLKTVKLLTLLILLYSGEVISGLRDLQSLSVDTSAEKEKQKAEAKHILQQKQRALSDLFKMLAEIGKSLHYIITQKEGKPAARLPNLSEHNAVPSRSVVP